MHYFELEQKSSEAKGTGSSNERHTCRDMPFETVEFTLNFIEIKFLNPHFSGEGRVGVGNGRREGGEAENVFFTVLHGVARYLR